ncbi:hypothetical protein NOS3756_58250 (plasmid) [Nostoc sp. NIES-3756]|uniref:DUF1392 family protein n=1 Tax=Nostoc sp. NIES-3756 TaxID=1751286 RepID=UPI00071F0AE7|nr:DUF1392 family protein [Nostoc sp. NIES-3756]BAT56813.1 hypothetical protein NOS3756_58250 [Nostoc sp. NIES-3756]
MEAITELEKCWYLSPPWGREIPPVEVNLWERVYIKASRTFGYCSGLGWSKGQWVYFIDLEDEVVHATKHEIVATGRMEPSTVKKPAYVIGDRVMLVGHAPGTKQRLVLGVQQVDRGWFYVVEWQSPMLVPTISMFNRSSLVREEDLVRVKV